MKRLGALAVMLAMAAVVALDATQERARRLFSPEELGVLEGPDRDAWQKPDRVMDALGIGERSVVADVGAGGGWFTVRLARRVGPNGLVYAEDVQAASLTAISRRVAAEGLANVKTVLGEGSNPRLPASTFHAVLIVDAYSEFEDRVTLLRNLAKSLRRDGRIGVVDFKLEGGGPGPPTEERVSAEAVIRDAASAGLRLLPNETSLEYQYFLIFGLQK